MRDFVLKAYVKAQELRNALKEEHGQDMVEYALVMGLIALGAAAAMSGLAGKIATGFNGIGTKVETYTS